MPRPELYDGKYKHPKQPPCPQKPRQASYKFNSEGVAKYEADMKAYDEAQPQFEKDFAQWQKDCTAKDEQWFQDSLVYFGVLKTNPKIPQAREILGNKDREDWHDTMGIIGMLL